MKYSLSEYILYFSIKLFAVIFQVLPLRFALFIGRNLGILVYMFDTKHIRIAYRNLRIAFAGRYTARQLKAILKMHYKKFGMNLIEVLRLPKVNKDYIDRYIEIKGKENLDNALNNKGGTIILGAHFGSWEICFAIAGILGYPFYIIAEEQMRNPLLNRFLNQIRQAHGVRVLTAGIDAYQVIRVLQEGNFVGMVVDHGIKEGVFVDFLGRKTRTPTAALKINLKFNVPILPAYLRRIKGPRHELVIYPPLEIKRTGNNDKDIISNLQTLNQLAQNYIVKYPDEYLWSYKRFKYSSERNVLFLHDGKTGHLRQGEAIIKLIKNIAQQKNLEIKTKSIEIDFKNKSAAFLQSLSISLTNRYSCWGCMLCLKAFLKPDTFRELQSYFADIVISCGAKTAAVNFIIANENLAKSIVLMRPGQLSTDRFDLVIAPYHDRLTPRDNVVKTEGALNLIDDDYLRFQASILRPKVKINRQLVLGLLIGGDTKNFKLTPELLKPLILQIKLFLERYDGQILITTSRRTKPEVEKLIKQEFNDYSRCKLLVIANEENIPEAMGGILGLSKIVVISPESISMISEAASSGKYVVVFAPKTNIGKRHTIFLEQFAKNKYIYFSEADRIVRVLDVIVDSNPEVVKLQDNQRVKQALERLL
jgi:KDO2-lipid IV(A) lauroyltransferase